MGIFNSLIAYVSNAMSLSTSTGYERALSEIHLLATQKCGRFFNYFLLMLARVSRRVPYKFSKLSERVRRRALSKWSFF